MISLKQRWISGIVAIGMAITGIHPIFAAAGNGFYCDFEEYTGGGLTVTNSENSVPWATTCKLSGNTNSFYAAETDKGTSIWMNVGDADKNDQYLAGTMLETPSTEHVVMQFDVMPLGLGSKTRFGFTGKKGDGTSVYQSLFFVHPNGKLEIYARGTISDSKSSISEQCYTENASVTLRKGNKLTYTDTEDITIPEGQWSNLAAVYRVAECKIDYFVNGELIFSNAIPFDFGNSLKSTGINGLRLQTGKYAGFSSLTEEEQNKVGLYVDNIKIFFGEQPDNDSEPSKTPESSETPEPSKTPEPSETPEPSKTPEPSETAGPAEPDSDYYYNINFENYTGGKIDGISGRFADQLTAVDTEYGNSLWMRSSKEKMIASGGSATDNYLRSVLGEHLTDNLVFQADFKPIGGNNYTYISMHNADNKKVGGVRIYNDGRITYYNGTAENAESTIIGTDGNEIRCPEGEWINIAVVFKIKDNVIDVYVNRQMVVKNSPIYIGTGVQDYRYINIQQTIYNDTVDDALNYDQQGLYIDNLKIYKDSYLHEDITYYESNFNGMTPGSYVADDLSLSYIKNGTCKIIEASESYGRSLYFDKANDYIRKELDTPKSGCLTASADINLQNNPNTNLFVLIDSSNIQVAAVRIEDGKIIANDGKTEQIIQYLEEKRWYTVEILYDLSEEVFTLSVDGNSYPDLKLCSNAINEVSAIQLENKSGSIMIDNVKISEKTVVPKLLFAEYYEDDVLQEDSEKLTHTVNKIKLYFNTAMRESHITNAAEIVSAQHDRIAYTADYDISHNILTLTLCDKLTYFETYTLNLDGAINKQGISFESVPMLLFSTNALFTAFEMTITQNGRKINSIAQLQTGVPVTVNLSIVSNSEETFDFVLCGAMYKNCSMVGMVTKEYQYGYDNSSEYSFDIDFSDAEEIDIFVLSSNEKPIPLYDSLVIGN